MIRDMIAMIDRIVALVRKRVAGQRKLFLVHLEPLFEEMTALHENYRQAFAAILQLCNSKQSSLDELHQAVVEGKAELEPLRDKVRGLWHLFWNEENTDHLPESAKNFIAACLPYFTTAAAQEVHYLHYRAHFTDLLEAINEHTHPHGIDKVNLAYTVNLVVDRMNEQWAGISQAYASARVQLLRSY